MSKKKPSVEISQNPDESEEQVMAKFLMNPKFKASHTIYDATSNYGEKTTLNEISKVLDKSTARLKNSDLSEADSLLISQAHTLDTVFHKLMRMSLSHENLKPFQALFTMAMKAQNQSRMTLATLGEIKNPKPYIQHNKAQYQQVNNGVPDPHAHGENLKQANELLEDNSDEWLDTRTPQETSGNDKELETVGAEHGAED